MFNSTKVMRGNVTNSWKLAAILDFGGHFDFSYLTAWHSDQNCFLDPYPGIDTENETLHKVEMTECLGTPLKVLKSLPLSENRSKTANINVQNSSL